MNVEEERSQSLWMEQQPPALPRFSGDLETDVLVIGAGIASLLTAYYLQVRHGRKVAVVDRGRFVRGMSARTSAWSRTTSPCDAADSLLSFTDARAAPCNTRLREYQAPAAYAAGATEYCPAATLHSRPARA